MITNNKENNLISIIIPVYNVENYLSECIESIYNQTYNNFEIILVDDGSTDSSGIICDKYCKKDKRIKVIHRKNKGVSSARNIGIKKAKGKFIVFIDSDDTVDNNYLKKLIDSMIENNTELVVCGIKVLSNRTIIRNLNSFNIKNLKDNSYIFYKLYDNGLLNSPCNKIFLKEKINFFNENVKMGEDLLFVLEYMNNINSISIINNPLYNYYKRPGSATMCFKKNIIDDTLRLYNEMIDFVSKYFIYPIEIINKLNKKFLINIDNNFKAPFYYGIQKKEIISIYEIWCNQKNFNAFLNSTNLKFKHTNNYNYLYYKYNIKTLPKRLVRKILKKIRKGDTII